MTGWINTTTIKFNIAHTTLLRYLASVYESKFHTLLNYCINISYYLYLRATNPTNCKGHPVIKRILQFRRLLDELSQFDPKKYNQIKKDDTTKNIPKVSKKSSVNNKQDDTQEENDLVLGGGGLENNSLCEDVDDDEHEKRGITYAIAKNKGLTPRRKKEQRNPRVKHREKFRKAKIRRKGQVRTARTETQRYGGETSGIKSHLTKSIKLK